MFPTFYLSSGSFGVEWCELGCRENTVSYTPNTDTTAARAGHLAVVVFRSTAYTGNLPATLPAGWRWFWTPTGSPTQRAFGQHRHWVAYKVLTGGDLTTTHTFAHAQNAADDDICGTAFIFPDFNANVPLDNMQWEGSQVNVGLYWYKANAYLTNKNVTVPGAYTFDILGYIGPSGSEDAVNTSQMKPFGAFPPDTLYSQFRSMLTWKTHVMLRESSLTGLQNLFSSEALNAPLGGWTPYGLTTYDLGLSAYVYSGTYKIARLVSNTTPGLHYVEQEVSLVAGRTYTLTWAFFQSAGGYTTYPNMGIGVIPPSGSGNEFGGVHSGYAQSGIIDLSSSPYNDPQAGRGTWWDMEALTTEGDGLPNFNTPRGTMVFTAQETGTYTFRVYAADGPNWADISHSTARTLYVDRMSLVEGIAPATWLPSTLPDFWQYVQPSPAYIYVSNTGNHGSHLSFQVNPSGPLPTAMMVPFAGQAPVWPSDDGLSVTSTSYNAYGNDNEVLLCNRLIYPARGGTLQKYYAEVTYQGAAGSVTNNYIGVGPVWASIEDIENVPTDMYTFAIGGAVKVPPNSSATSAPWTPTVGDKFGILVDYDAEEVTLYKNGVVLRTVTMEATAGEEHVDQPFLFVAECSRSYGAGVPYFDFNFTGPFSYKPVGAVAWDAENDAS